MRHRHGTAQFVHFDKVGGLAQLRVKLSNPVCEEPQSLGGRPAGRRGNRQRAGTKRGQIQEGGMILSGQEQIRQVTSGNRKSVRKNVLESLAWQRENLAAGVCFGALFLIFFS